MRNHIFVLSWVYNGKYGYALKNTLQVHSMRECDRLCCLSLDEMEITTAYEYDAGSKQVLGDVTLPGQDGAASHGLVVMLGGMFKLIVVNQTIKTINRISYHFDYIS